MPALSAEQQRARYTGVAAGWDTWLALDESGKPVTNSSRHKKVPDGTKGIASIECGRHLNAVITKKEEVVWLSDENNTRHCPEFEPGTIAKLSLGHSLNAALLKDGTLKVFGYVYRTLPDFPRADLMSDVADVCAGSDVLAIRLKNDQIHIVDQKGVNRKPPFDGKDVIAMECGIAHGVVFLWKDGSVTETRHADPPEDMKKAVQIRVAPNLAAAQHEDGTWTIWGSDERASGELNAKLEELGPLKDLALGSKFFLAIQ